MPIDDRAHLFDELAAAWFRAGKARDAERLWREQARLQPDNLRPRLALLDLALQSRDDSALVPLIRELRQTEGEDGPFWRYGEAARLALRARSGDRSGLATARRLWGELNKRSGGSAQLALLAADLDELEGQPGRAVENYQLAVELGERRPEIVRTLTVLLVERRRFAEADRALRRLEEQGPLGRELARRGADLAVRLNDPERAAELARRAVPGETRDYRDQVWLGRVLAAVGRPREAEAVLRRRTETNPAQAEPWVALAEVLARDGQWARAEEVAKEVHKCVDPERRPLALARLYEAADRCDLAERQYHDAAASRPDDFLLLRQAAAFHLRMDQPGRAEPYLRRLLDPRTGAPEEDAAWARRRLALALAGDEGAPRRGEALALLEQNLARRQNSLADVRARVLVVASWPNQRREGLRQFQASLNDLPAGPDDLLVAARLYEADGDGIKAREHRVSLLALDGRNPQYLAHQIRGLLRADERGEAAVYLARLEQVQPRAERTRELGKLLRQGN
jgi:predicted Zn-dependent protease